MWSYATILFTLIAFFNVFLVWYFYVGLSSPPTAPNDLPPIVNVLCPDSIIQKDVRRDINKNLREPTLVIYVYAETSNLKRDNFEFFIKNGLCENCYNIDYAIIINGKNMTVNIPQQKNIQIYQRENKCGDFGAWGWFFALVGPTKYKKYKRFMFINDTVRGPYIDPNYLLLFGRDFHFTDIFAAALTNETRIVGSYLSCGVIDVKDKAHAHVQTMSFMMDQISLELAIPLMKCYDTHDETIKYGEIGLSKKLIENNINLGSLLYAYKGADFRCNSKLRQYCNEGLNPTIQTRYFKISTSPTEVVFLKIENKVGLSTPNWDVINNYSEWVQKGGLSV